MSISDINLYMMQMLFYELTSHKHENVEVNHKTHNFAADSDNLSLIVLLKKWYVRL
jgi:hypothetical protein